MQGLSNQIVAPNSEENIPNNTEPIVADYSDNMDKKVVEDTEGSQEQQDDGD